jgi:hypothetical protein
MSSTSAATLDYEVILIIRIIRRVGPEEWDREIKALCSSWSLVAYVETLFT